tara:strand:+ start:2223 stop:3290 length:1068 start_codon:yes stop_codon:yes gene_type:complete
MKKIAIVGAGNAGCITALELLNSPDLHEITIYHSPKEHPIEKVGQGTLPGFTRMLYNKLGVDWYNNPIDATVKTGILYEGWGKNQDKIFHQFCFNNCTASHFVPKKLSNLILESGLFNIEEKIIYNPEQQIDCDIIFDCRGRHNIDKNNYDTLISPINSVLLGKRSRLKSDHDLIYTRAVATPNGWTFIIPNKDTISYGYLHNNNVTSKHDACEDFVERFDINCIDDYMTFDNYAAKNMFVGERTILQGNAYGFIEPLEATAINFYHQLCVQAKNTIFDGVDPHETNNKVKANTQRIETFLLWHYQFGSKYDSPFWEYAKNLPFNPKFSAKSLNEVWQKTERGLDYVERSNRINN